ncbi:MAG: hypothetical protein ABW208_14155 [Pyrinomonadaceae bacterium]
MRRPRGRRPSSAPEGSSPRRPAPPRRIVERERGRIRPGMAADIIAAPADPLADIQALKRVNFVMKDGAVFRNEAEARP